MDHIDIYTPSHEEMQTQVLALQRELESERAARLECLRAGRALREAVEIASEYVFNELTNLRNLNAGRPQRIALDENYYDLIQLSKKIWDGQDTPTTNQRN